MHATGRRVAVTSTITVLLLLLAIALGAATLISRTTSSSRQDAAQVLQMESIRRLAAEQRMLEGEAALSGAASPAVLDRFDGLRAEMDAAFAQLDMGEGEGRQLEAQRRAASYQHVLDQQLQLIHDGYLTSAAQFGETRVRDLGASLTELLAAEQAELLDRAARRAQRADGAMLVTLLIGAVLLGAAIVVVARAQRARLAARDVAARTAEALGRHASDLVAVLDTSGRIGTVGSSTGPLLGIEPDDLLGRRLLDLVHAEERPAVRAALRTVENGEAVGVRARLDGGAGGWRHLDLILSDGIADVGGVVLNGHDVTALTELQLQLQHQATHDGLTGLPNRVKLEADATRVLHETTKTGVTLLLLDLDDFKHVNDSMGHAAGDVILIETAARLRQVAPAGSTAARLGGDEFALLLPDGTAAEGSRIAEAIVTALSTPVLLDGRRIAVGCSVGLAVVTPESRDVGTLLQHADAAMYAAKRAGKNRTRRFARPMLAAAARRVHVLGDLREALAQDQLVLHYQPVVSLASGRVTQVEALVRWQHPDRGLLPPSEFVPVAEESGLILPIGRWVLSTACEAAVRWQAGQGEDPVALAVNVSPRELTEPTFCGDVAATLLRTGLAPHLLTIEITEQVLAGDLDEMLERLASLAALGIKLAIDDFGTGYSSLSHLRRFPFHSVKIAREFVEGTGEGEDAVAFLAAIIGLAGTLGLETVAEGVEDAAQLEAVRALGCVSAQGFHLADALPLEALEAFVALHQPLLAVTSGVRRQPLVGLPSARRTQLG